MNLPISYRLAELVREHISTPYVRASDTDVSRALGLTRNAMYEYKRGHSRMSAETVARALELLGEARHKAAPLLAELQEAYQPSEPQRAIWRLLMSAAESMRDRAASIVLAIVAAGTFLAPSPNQAIASDLSLTDLYTMRNRKRRKARRWARLFTVFPVAIALTGCATLDRLPAEEYAWQALHLADALQTYDAARDPCFREGYALTRALIGERPDAAKVAAWTVGMSVAHASVTHWLVSTDRPRLAKAWSFVTIGEKAYAVGNNYSIGIRIGGTNKTPAGCTR